MSLLPVSTYVFWAITQWVLSLLCQVQWYQPCINHINGYIHIMLYSHHCLLLNKYTASNHTVIFPFLSPKLSFNNTCTSYDFNFVRGGTVQKYFRYENFVHEFRNCMHGALLYICMLRCYMYLYTNNTHVYARQALNHSINMCYASV